MIDSHTHTFYSKHATGSVDEVVRSALARGIGVLTLTDHAPFHVDSGNRLLERELDAYFEDIERARSAYRADIKIMRGLEFDYLPGSEAYTARMLARYELDFAIGSIHYVRLTGQDMVKVWELDRLRHPAVLEGYFASLSALLECGLFDAAGHADSLVRGVPEPLVCRYMEPLAAAFARHSVAFELNASGLRKTSLDPLSGRETGPGWSHPSRALLPVLIDAGAAFTIGSDAHTPEDVGAGLKPMLDALVPLGLRTVSYFEQRRRVDVDAASLAMAADYVKTQKAS
ncbi:histidinol-phosphatase [Paraburkholderia caribensis]|uniref:histidinol-phosphatase n=1 Tax=Paraburkholderia caribensis TaxID=75105 RepID=UPI001CAEA7E7|nr:histidinol-phosphatase [Paraburkholderia caribensis]CAG9269781.1 Histidinol-phosphatase [Paraburkholderia caribensis]